MTVTHPALQEAHLEPTMTDAQISQEIERQQDDVAAHELEHGRQERTELETSAPPARHREIERAAAAPRSPEAVAARKASIATRPSRSAAASQPTHTRNRSR